MDEKTPDNLRYLNDASERVQKDSDGLAKPTSKMRGAYMLGLASALAGGVTPSETSVSRHLNRKRVAFTHVSRATLNRSQPIRVDGTEWIGDSHDRRKTRKVKRKARMRLRARRGRWC